MAAFLGLSLGRCLGFGFWACASVSDLGASGFDADGGGGRVSWTLGRGWSGEAIEVSGTSSFRGGVFVCAGRG